MWIHYHARGDGSLGQLQDPKEAKLVVDKDIGENEGSAKVVDCNQAFLNINQNNAGSRVLEYKGMLEFVVDSRAYTKSFELVYGRDGDGE